MKYFTLGSPFISTAASGADSPKLSSRLSHHHQQSQSQQSHFQLSPTSAFNLAASFRSPNSGLSSHNSSAFIANGFPFNQSFYSENNYMRQNSALVDNNDNGDSPIPNSISGDSTVGGKSLFENSSEYNQSAYINNNNIDNLKEKQSRLHGNNSEEDDGDIVDDDEDIDPVSTRQYDNPSPVDSSKSYAISHRSSGGENSESSPPPSSHYFSEQRHSEMLDHKLPLSFLGPPLAALHSMAEMKSPGAHNNNNNNTSSNNNNSSSNGNSNVNSSNNVNGSFGGLANHHQPHSTSNNTHGTANPHGIDTILSKPPAVTSAGLSALTGGKCWLISFR